MLFLPYMSISKYKGSKAFQKLNWYESFEKKYFKILKKNVNKKR